MVTQHGKSFQVRKFFGPVQKIYIIRDYLAFWLNKSNCQAETIQVGEKFTCKYFALAIPYQHTNFIDL